MRTIRVMMLMLVTNIVLAQHHSINFKHLSIENGLSQNTIHGILRDKKGLMWFGTRDGLNVYNGVKFHTYRRDLKDKNTLNDNYIQCLYQDSKGNFWVGTRIGGLNLFNQENQTFKSYKHNANSRSVGTNNIFRMIEGDKNTLWIGSETEGLFCFDLQERKFTDSFKNIPQDLSSLCNNNVNALLKDKLGNIWVGTENGLDIYNSDKKKICTFINDPKDPTTISHNYINTIYEDAEKNVWVGTKDGLNLYDFKKENFTNFHTYPNLYPKGPIKAIEQDDYKNLWASVQTVGVYILNLNRKSSQLVKYNEYDPTSLNQNDVISIYKDPDGNLWLGTVSEGINYYNAKNRKFQHYKNEKGESQSLGNNNVRDIIEDHNGNLWIGTEGDGVNVFDRKNETFKHIRDTSNGGISSTVIFCVKEDNDGNIWLGHLNNGLDCYNPKTNKVVKYKAIEGDTAGLLANQIKALHADKKGNLWIGTQRGLNVLDLKTRAFKTYNHIPSDPHSLVEDFVVAISEDSEGKIWLGTYGGVSVMDPKTEKFTNYVYDDEDSNSISHNAINIIMEDRSGQVWVGTNGGLSVFDKKEKKFKRIMMKDGLPNDMVVGLLPDNKDRIWISTNKGISCYDPKNKSFKNFTATDGLQSDAFKRNSCCKTRSGELIFGGIKGFNIFHPDSIPYNPVVPSIVISDFQIFNNSVVPGPNSILEKDISYTDKLVLSYKESVMSFEFAALDYSIPEKNQYAYQLVGFDKGWNNIGNKHSVTYTNLDPGEYTFKVKGSNNDGIWNETGTSLSIVITPPFWLTWWFRTLVGLVVIGSAISWYRIRINTIKRQKQVLEQQVKERTAEVVEQKEEILQQQEELVSQNEKIEDLYTEMKDSIRAAQILQSSLLPSEALVKTHLPQSFILYKPKDVVSGDFYWFAEKDDKVIIAAVDCTGHGVSGAFMSINAYHLIARSIFYYDNIVAGEVLDRLNEGLIKELSNIDVNDGMDIALCVIDRDMKRLQYAGAINPLYIVRNNEIIQVKGNKFAIGLSVTGQVNKFTNNEVELQKGDMIYLFSDGYADQFGGECGNEKFMYNRFREMILNISDKDMPSQQQALDKCIEEWRGSVEQLDDILVIGFRV